MSSLKFAGVAVTLGFAACGGQAEDGFPPSFSDGVGSNGTSQPPLGAGGTGALGSGARGGTGSSVCIGSVCGFGGVSFGAGGSTSFAAGGAFAAGGGTAMAGAGGVGGTGGVFGAGGSSFLPDPVSTVYAFDSGLEGFGVKYYCASSSMCAHGGQLPDEDATVLTDFVTWGHDPAEGFQSPAGRPGSARLEIRFNGAGGLVDFARYATSPSDLRNKRLTVQVKLASGPITTAALYIKTGPNYFYADAGKVTLIAGQWVQLAFPSPDGAGFMTGSTDMSDVREIGIELAAASPTNLPAVVFIDNVAY